MREIRHIKRHKAWLIATRLAKTDSNGSFNKTDTSGCLMTAVQVGFLLA